MENGQAFKIGNVGSEHGGRLFWLDVLRALAACAVVMMHTLTGAVDIMNTAAYEDGQWMLLNCYIPSVPAYRTKNTEQNRKVKL